MLILKVLDGDGVDIRALHQTGKTVTGLALCTGGLNVVLKQERPFPKLFLGSTLKHAFTRVKEAHSLFPYLSLFLNC